MKVQKAINILATLSFLGLAVACNDGGSTDRYQEGFTAGKTAGYQEGYDAGYADGDADGYARAEAYFKTADYAKGFSDGQASGYTQGYTVGKSDGTTIGYNNGYNAGYTDGHADGKDEGYDLGYADGHADGYDAGVLVSYQTGYNAGYSDGTNDGYDAGYDDGHTDGYVSGQSDGYNSGYAVGDAHGYDVGYDTGYDDGYDAAYGLSVGPTPKMKGYADVLSAFHNQLIDYSKIKMPVQTKRGLVANGQLLLSEVSLTNKDTLKKAAAVEQYLVIEMAKQVNSKFGLSLDRSLKVAKAANHFRKYSTKRALTAEDTNAYANEIIGVSFKKIEKAFDSSRKGDLSEMKEVMDAAAEKNEVSPEQMQTIVQKMFI